MSKFFTALGTLLIIFGLVKLVLAMIQKHREERCSHGKKEI